MKKLLLTISLISLSFLTYSQGYWEEVQDVDPFGALNKCFFTDSNNGWAVGQKGIIQHTTDGGLNWELQHNNPDMLFRSGCHLNQNEAWVVGWSNILHTSDAGQNWETQIRPPCLGDLNDVFFLDQNNGWIVGWYKIVLKTTDGGQNWQKISNQTSSGLIYNSVKFFDENNGVLCGVKQNIGGIIMITSDGGLTWTETGPITTSEFLSLDINTAGDVFVCGSDGSLYKSTDMGNSWTDQSIQDYYFYDIEFGEDQTAYLMSRLKIHKSTDNGETWNIHKNVPYQISLRDINIGGDQLFGCGGKTSVYNILEEDVEWERLLYNNPLNFNDISFVNENEGFALRGRSFIGQSIKTNDGGYTWQEDTLIPDQEFYHLRSINQTLFYISTDNNLLKTSDGGQTWEIIELNLEMSNWYINDFSVPSENTLYLCNDSSVLYKSVDGGYNWDRITFTEYHKFSISYFYDDDFGWLVDDYTGFLLRTTDGGSSWTSMKVDPSHTWVPSSIYFINENVGFITTEMGFVYRTTDGGDNWEEVFETETTFRPIFYFVNETMGYFINRHYIFISEDAGLTWTEYQLLTGNATCASFLNTNSWIAGMYDLMAINKYITDINDISVADLSFKLYPNPATDKITISTEILLNNAEVYIYTISGSLVSVTIIGSNMEVDISDLPRGSYLLKIKTAETSLVNKFVKL